MHVFPKSTDHFRTIYTVGPANRFCYVNHTIKAGLCLNKKDELFASGRMTTAKACLTRCKSSTC
jgi:hypothetical protein